MALPTAILSLCSGYEGLGLAVRLVYPGARVVCHVERESYAAACLVARMEDAALEPAPIWDDLATFDGEPWRGKVDCVTAGYPCQPFSLAGKHKGADDERYLWPEVRRVVAAVDPWWCFFENVAGHLHNGAREVICDLHGLGYEVAATLWTAEEVGAPHRRERLFILAYRDGRELSSLCRPPTAGADVAYADIVRGDGERLRVSIGGSRQAVLDADGADIPVADAKYAIRRENSTGNLHSWREENADGILATGKENPSGIGASGEMVDDASEPGLEGQRGERSDLDAQCAPPERDRLPIFPPGRNPDDWRGIPAAFWPSASKPEFRRMDDGPARFLDRCWADRLRLCGNGVVPLQAAAALVELVSAVGERGV